MAKEKQSSEKTAPKKTAAKKSPEKKVAVPKKSAEVIANTVPVAAPNLTAASLKTATPSPAELYEEIRRRAYEFYNERGGQHGSHEADWHRAEAEVRAKYKS